MRVLYLYGRNKTYLSTGRGMAELNYRFTCTAETKPI